MTCAESAELLFSDSERNSYAMVRIFHTGDVHLDSAFSNFSPSHAEARRRDLRATFTSMTLYAQTQNIDIMLIAGDLFEDSFATRETIDLVKREFAKLKCPVVISPGNHDPYSESGIWKSVSFSDNVYVFDSDELSYFDFPDLGVRVFGWSFTSKRMEVSPLTGKSVRDFEGGENYINLLCAHCDLTSPISKDCPVTLQELKGFGADYCALGHIHNPTDYGDGIAYCGCPEGRAFDEKGPKGALVVTVSDNDAVFGQSSDSGRRITVRKERFSKRRYEEDILRVDGAASNGELRDMISSYLTSSKFGDDTILRLTLTGEISPSFVLSSPYLESEPPRIFALKILDKTTPALDIDALRADPTLKGEFFRQLEDKLTSNDPDTRAVAALALRAGLAALAGEAVTE